MRFLLAAAALLALGACSDDATPSADVAASDTDVSSEVADTPTDIPDVDPPPACDDTRRPIVLAHGFLASGDTWSPHARRFAANGWCADRIFAFDWNTLNRTLDHAELLDAFIDEVLETTGADAIDLVGHSAGGGLAYEYLEEQERAAKVAHYVHVASFIEAGPAGPDGDVPTLNLWSAADFAIEDAGEIPGAENAEIVDADHYAVATSEASFAAIYPFLADGEEPSTTTVTPTDEVILGGRVLSLGENIVPSGSTVNVWLVDVETGARVEDEPSAEFVVGDDGAWGPFDAEPGAPYEFEVIGPNEEDIPVSYYRQGFTASDPLVYLRTLPAPGTAAGALLAVIPFDHEAPVLVVFSASTGMIAGINSLQVDGNETLTEETAAAEDTTIAVFLFDGNENLESELTVVGLFATFPFLAGLDIALPQAPIRIELDGRVLVVAGRPATERALIAVFE